MNIRILYGPGVKASLGRICKVFEIFSRTKFPLLPYLLFWAEGIVQKRMHAVGKACTKWLFTMGYTSEIFYRKKEKWSTIQGVAWVVLEFETNSVLD